MKEIKFRGKRINNGEWVYGYLYGRNAIISLDSNYTVTSLGTLITNIYEVDPKTVGQYANRADINEIKIYEGDIFKSNKGVIAEVYWLELDATFACKNSKVTFHPNWTLGHFSMDSIEVIGNIYDNPNLLD